MFVFMNYNKAERIQQTLKLIHYSLITTNSQIQLKDPANAKIHSLFINYYKFTLSIESKKCLQKSSIESFSLEARGKRKKK